MTSRVFAGCGLVVALVGIAPVRIGTVGITLVRALSFKRPLLSLSVDVCLCVRNFEVKYLANERSQGLSYYWEHMKVVRGYRITSNGDLPDDVT